MITETYARISQKGVIFREFEGVTMQGLSLYAYVYTTVPLLSNSALKREIYDIFDE